MILASKIFLHAASITLFALGMIFAACFGSVVEQGYNGKTSCGCAPMSPARIDKLRDDAAMLAIMAILCMSTAYILIMFRL